MNHNYSGDVVSVIDSIIDAALQHNVSDIHFESQENVLRVRFRVDGMLYDHTIIDHIDPSHVRARLKVLANIDVSQTRIPQDGKYSVAGNSSSIDIRVATFPAVLGEKVVLRLLHQKSSVVKLSKLGMQDCMLDTFKTLVQKASGFLLVSGPTGAGKTTTLYAALSALNTSERNIITLEDPVEYRVDGITQGQVHAAIGFDFSDGMRALLRQDPDIILIGEMRDELTARTAVQAALTGHMVLSTVHTVDTASVIIRLMDMNIKPFLINAALSGVVAQRLARLLCPACKKPYAPNDDEKKFLATHDSEIDQLYKADGCDTCNKTGHKGRIGIFELLVMEEQVKSCIIERPSLQDLQSIAQKIGMQTMLKDGLEKVKQGLISLDEIVRILV